MLSFTYEKNCYDLPIDIVNCSGDFEILLPPIDIIGGLYSVSDYNLLMDWFKNVDNIDYVVVALDTVAYGSLVASRRIKLSYDDIKNRLDYFKKLLIEKNVKTYAFSSIMRISNNNVNEEEKEYWKDYGTKIFKYSYDLHRCEQLDIADENLVNDIPKDILEDYISTRERNFSINKLYLDWLKQGTIDTLVFSKDDCAKFGFNVKEADELASLIAKNNLNGVVKTGADEIPLTLLSKIFTENKNIKIYPLFSNECGKNLISNYEDISIEKSVLSQIELSGCKVAKDANDTDLILYVNNFEEKQGELVMNIDTTPFGGNVPSFDRPYFCADVRFANGADNAFVEKLFEHEFDEKYYGYSGWNTSANTLGSAIALALAKFCSENFNNDAFKKLQMIRFLDDWAYQANVRLQIRNDNDNLNNDVIYDKMLKFEKIVEEKIKYYPENIKYSYPWDRFFEIRIKI